MTQDADTTRIQRLRTDRGEREEVAGESSADLPRIYREVPVGLCYLDTDLRFVHVNEWLAALSGLSVEEHLGRAIGEVLPDVAAAVESQLRGVIETKEPLLKSTVEAETPIHPGVRRHYQYDYYPDRSEGGTIVGVSCLVRDITECKRAEEQLATQSRVLESMAEGVNVSGVDGVISFTSSAFDRMFGYKRGELIGRHVSVLNGESPNENARIVDMVSKALETHGVWRGEFNNVKKDGSPFVTMAHISRLEFSGERHYVSVQQDITEQKQAARQVQQLHEELAHMGRMSTAGEMATGLAHELTQPLAAIVAYAEGCLLNVRPRGEKGDKLVHALEQIKSSVEQTGEIVRRLRNLVRKREPRRSTVDINESVVQIAKMVESTARLHAVELDLRLTEGLPTVDADSIQIRQVILNLVRNALEAVKKMPVGERKVTIWTNPSPDNGVEVVVEDEGEGMSRETLDRAFEAFFTTKPDGLGLGLSISKSISEAHGGRLWSTPNGDHGSAGNDRRRQMRAPGAVYIVDDSAGVRRSLQWMLGSAGFLVEAYGSARQFLDACHPMIGGCLLLDVRMPGMDGLGLQQELDTLGFTIPVIFITGDGDVEMAARATRAGAFDFLEKPFNASLLLDRVRQAIAQDNQARSDREARSEIARRLSLLTSRERQVLDMVVAGKANKVIASELGISDRTVEKHRAKVMRKCKASSLAELVSMACSSRDSRQLGPPS